MSRSIRFLGMNVLLALLVFTALRIAFWLTFRSPSDTLPLPTLLEASYVGLKFDLRLALLLNLPFAVLGFVPVLDPFRSRRARPLWVAYFALSSFVVLLFYAVDFGHYGYLEARIDASVLRFLGSPRESFGVLWGSYPLVSGTLALVLVAGGYALLLRRLFGEGEASPRRPLGARVAVAALVACLYAFGIYGKFSYYPLRWSDAYFSTNAFASALSLNPLLYFVETYDNRDVEYDLAAVRAHYASLASYLGVADPDPEHVDFTRPAGGPTEAGQRLNVVIVLLESFAWYKTGVSGNPLGATPNFDEIASQGVLFRRFYTPHSGTARSVFASVVGLPDIDRSETSTRNPLIARQHSLLNAFDGWDKLYFLGGSASWGNIRALLSHNVRGLHIYEEGSYTSPRVDVWGISDASLLEEANRVLREPRDRPFVAIIQTAGNHKPYTIPDEGRGFQRSSESEAEVRRFGFDTLKEYEAMRLVDHSLGHFFRLARQEHYYDDTLFVLYGDHGSPGSPEHMPAAEGQLTLARYHVPLLLYAPKHLAPRVVDEVASQLDALPTIVKLAGAKGVNSTLGRDLFDPAFAGRRYAFTIERLGRNPVIGLITRDFYYQAAADGSTKQLQRIDSASPRDDLSAQLPETAVQLDELVFGLYEATRWMRYHNAPEAVAAEQARGGPSVAAGPGPKVR